MNKNHKITIFTDGASRGNPGQGGFAAIVIFPESNDNRGEFKVESLKSQVVEFGGRDERTTNNRMELRAAIEALSFLKNLQLTTYNLQLYSDSRYLINGITKWIFGWQKNGWKKTDKSDVENEDLWKKLYDVSRDKKIEWKYVGGHIGIAGNERCDQIAQMFADMTQMNADKIKLYCGLFENYWIKNILDISTDEAKEKTKSDSKLKSKAKPYSYVSWADGAIQTHQTWADCERRVKGKSGAKHKKALNAEEEENIIKIWRDDLKK